MKSLLIRLMPAALLCLALTACGGGGAVGQTPYDPAFLPLDHIHQA